MPIRTAVLTPFVLVGAALAAAPGAAAQDTTIVADSIDAARSAAVPVRQLGAVEARSAQSVGNVNTLRALPDGSVFVNDVARRQLVRFDAALKDMRVLADTLEAPIPYGQRPAGLLPYLGDSTLIVDPTTLSLLVLNAEGSIARVMSAPRPGDLNALASANLGSHAFDSKGRLIYRLGGPGGGGGPPAGFMAFGGGGRPGAGGRGGPGGPPGAPQPSRAIDAGPPGSVGAPPAEGAATTANRQGAQNAARGRNFNPDNQPDSVPILRADFDTRRVDTVTFLKVPKNMVSMTQTDDGEMRLTAKLNPLPQGDDWALLADGTVAVVRVLDYRVDFYTPDGEHVRGTAMPFDWKRLTDDDKVRLIDSIKTVAAEATERAQAMAQQRGGRGGFRFNLEPVEPELLPDYYPPIRPGNAMADYDGNIWIPPSTSTLAGQLAASVPAGARGQMGAMGAMGGLMGAPSALVYDVIDRRGNVVERIQLPAGRSLAGFGPGGAVYLSARQGRDVFLERVRRDSATPPATSPATPPVTNPGSH